MRKATQYAVSLLVMVVAIMGACLGAVTSSRAHAETVGSASLFAPVSPRFQVSGSGIVFAATQLVHSVEPTPTGLIQRSTTALQLSGDMSGSILFNATSAIDFVSGTIVNTGTQFFSGTVAGSEPVILHDDSFRFEIDLNTGATFGTVHFSRSLDAPHNGLWFDCDLVVVGTGITPDGDLTSDYTGECIQRGNSE